jgi:hypothetical protein
VVVSQDKVFLYEKKISLKGNFKNYFIIYIKIIFFFLGLYNLKECIVPLVSIFADIKPVDPDHELRRYIKTNIKMNEKRFQNLMNYYKILRLFQN